MSVEKWTPGPWKVFTPDDYEGPAALPGLGIESESDGDAVVWYADRPESGINHDDDANLIAAAPELYEALDALVSELDDNEPQDGQWHGSPAQKKCIAVMAKARGE